MCTIREFGERMHKEFTTGQILGFVHPDASTHRGHGHSIEEGAQS
jgi:TPP-dependent pyruvate/acetoin dehydrogenase alpha subunit